MIPSERPISSVRAPVSTDSTKHACSELRSDTFSTKSASAKVSDLEGRPSLPFAVSTSSATCRASEPAAGE